MGLGNRLRGDDRAGPEVARLLAGRAAGIASVVHEREPTDLIDLWEGHERVVVVDAVAGHEPGRVHTFDASARALPEAHRPAVSSHAIGLAEVIELARELDRLPVSLRVVAIEGNRFGLGEEASEEVLASARTVARELSYRAPPRA